MDLRLGWKKDKFDYRDHMHAYKVFLLPNEITLSIPSVRNQGSEGSCVGHGIGANLTAEGTKAKVTAEWFSPRWIYNGARYLEGWMDRDDGCYPRDALDWCLKKGCLPEQFWPYKAGVDTYKVPSSKLDTEASKYPLLEYFRVDNGTSGICNALAQGFCVSIGTPWFSKWMSPKNGVLLEVKASDSVAGGHETMLYGYNTVSQMFYGMNSWGTSWGKKGLYTMPFQAFDVMKNTYWGYDAYYVRVNWGTQPTPEPTKNKIQLLINGKEEYSKEI